jgi:hypothetical protein
MAKSYNFGEKKTEYNAKLGKEVEVWQSPKYIEAKKKAIETLESDMYKGVLSEGDFWILMNATKSGKMAYTGLIISHNGCLKINDVLPADKRFKPSCVQLDKNGYNDSLVYSYSNDEQGIFEVGEVSLKNCTNAYPYAMALKRCMDRVILKNSKLAYSGIYSDSEAEEFKNEPKETKETKKTESSAPLVVVPEGKSARQALVDYCNERNIDIRVTAARFHLNNDSSDQEFIDAMLKLMEIREEI